MLGVGFWIGFLRLRNDASGLSFKHGNEIVDICGPNRELSSIRELQDLCTH